MPRHEKWSIWFGIAAIAALAILYAAIPSYRYFWDTLIDCHYLEGKFDVAKLMHPLHPLFPLTGYYLFRALEPDITGRSIYMLKSVSMIFSLIGLIAFYAILKRATATHFLSAVATLTLGLTVAWWQHSISGNTLIIAMTFILLSLLFYLPGSEGRIGKIPMALHRLFFTIAVLFSRICFLFLIPFVIVDYIRRYGASGSHSKALTRTVAYTLITLLCAAIPFLLIPALSLGIRTPADFVAWSNDFPGALPHLTGGTGDRFRGLLTTGLGDIIALPGIVNVAFKAYQGAPPNLRSTPYFIAFIVLAISFLASIVYTSTRWNELNLTQRIFALFNISAVIIVGGYIIVRQPYAITIYALPSFASIFALWAFSVTRGKPKPYAWLWLLLPAMILTNNWFVKFSRDRFPSTNPYIYEASSVPHIIGEGDLLIDSGVNEGLFRHAYLLYFSGIDSRNLFQIPGVLDKNFEEFSIEMTQHLNSGHKIFIHEDALQNEDSMRFLINGIGADYTPEELLDFISNVIEPRYYFVINAKKYYAFELKSGGLQPPEIPMLPVIP